MLTWPDVLLQNYPFSTDTTRFPGRPWWVLREGLWYRSSGEIVSATLNPLNEDTAAQIANIDSTYPLAHPGYRVGQVWGNAEGEASQVIAVASGPHNVIWGRTSPGGYPFLIHDPVCPWLAPWAPATL